MNAPVARVVETPVHGRYVVRQAQGKSRGVIIGFHGYAETAEVHLAALEAIPGIQGWDAVAVQALHPFYTRDQRVVANWMTSQDRDLAIADNLAYVTKIVNALGPTRPRVFAGFSQGGAMAYRAAAHIGADGLIVLAADVPPDVAALPRVTLPRVLLGRGTADAWYTAEKYDADLATLAGRAAGVEPCPFDGGHEWAPPFYEAAGRYLAAL